jgi:hypothetical protein
MQSSMGEGTQDRPAAELHTLTDLFLDIVRDLPAGLAILKPLAPVHRVAFAARLGHHHRAAGEDCWAAVRAATWAQRPNKRANTRHTLEMVSRFSRIILPKLGFPFAWTLGSGSAAGALLSVASAAVSAAAVAAAAAAESSVMAFAARIAASLTAFSMVSSSATATVPAGGTAAASSATEANISKQTNNDAVRNQHNDATRAKR